MYVHEKLLVGIFVFFSLLLSVRPAFAERGIVVAVNDFYADRFFTASIEHLRVNIKCELPIEIWYSGDELSEKTKNILGKFSNVSFHDIAEVLHVNRQVYRGWQIKPWIISLSRFDEVILMDADVFFFEDPESLFDHPGYKETGAFFFCDLRHLYPNNQQTLQRYLNRRKFINSLVPHPSPCVPKDMHEIWGHNIPTNKRPFVGDLQESGCIAMDKKKHELSMEYIIELNENRAVTYKYVWGDKETFWMGCEMAGLPYHMNDQRAYGLESGGKKLYVTQFVGDKLFYVQKAPFFLNQNSLAVFGNNEGYRRAASKEEKTKINQAWELVKLRRKLPSYGWPIIPSPKI